MIAAAFGLFAFLSACTQSSEAQIGFGPKPEGGILVPYEPTPNNVVEGMLKIGEVGPQDFLIDLGSGDGRIVIAAAKNRGARGLGVDLNPDLVARSIENAKTAGVADRVSFRQEDIFKTDLSQATVITMFLFPQVNLKLRPRLLELKPGTRIVSHFHDMADWRPDRQQRLMTTEHYGDTWIFEWVVPAKVAGRWEWTEQRSGVTQRHLLDLYQSFQEVKGRLTTDSLRPIELRDAKLVGDKLTFWVPLREGSRTARVNFEGRASGTVIEGIETRAGSNGASAAPWSPQRAGDAPAVE
jgi:hypothetical protein